jgi:gag-polypeptide of LTR copia-type
VAELVDWNAKSTDSYTAIGLALMPNQVIHIHDCVDAPLTWNALGHTYLRNSTANQISLKHHLYGTRHDQKDSIHLYIKNITTLASQLHAMGVTRGEDITSQTSSYSIYQPPMTWHGQVTVSDVLVALIEYESHNKSDSNTNVSNSAHAARSSTCVKGKIMKDLNGMICHCCQKLGYYVHDCTAITPIQSEDVKFTGYETTEW